MLKKGDIYTIVLLFVNLAFIGLVITKGAYTLPAVSETAAVVIKAVDDLGNETLVTYPLPRVNTTPLVETSPTITLAVDDNNDTARYPWIQSNPTAPPTLSTPVQVPVEDDVGDVDIPSYDDAPGDKPGQAAEPAHNPVVKTKHKNNKK
jgi:hypothetical protein